MFWDSIAFVTHMILKTITSSNNPGITYLALHNFSCVNN